MTSSPDREIVSERLIRCARGRVFSASSDPVALAEWWGPAGFTNAFQEFDFRPGGLWRFVMRSPDGTEFPMEKRFTEIVEPERIQLRHLDPVHGFVMTMGFAAEGSGTRVTWTMMFDSPEEAARVRSFVVDANEENFDRLEAWLAGR